MGLVLGTVLLAGACSNDLTAPVALPVEHEARLRPVGAEVLSDGEAASRVRPSDEHRPDNAVANSTVPTAEQLASYLRTYVSDTGSARFHELKNRVTGNFRGTTDEIIQWVAWKWGLPEDVVRAEAVQESEWHMSAVGDGGRSFGLMQIKDVAQPGTYPMSRTSTAFNLDHYGMVIRAYYEAVHPWLRGARAGDFWGAVGAWWSGRYRDAGAEAYIERVQRELARRAWEDPDF